MPELKSVYFKFGPAQYTVEFVETKDKLSSYDIVSYKHNREDAGKAVEDMRDP